MRPLLLVVAMCSALGTSALSYAANTTETTQWARSESNATAQVDVEAVANEPVAEQQPSAVTGAPVPAAEGDIGETRSVVETKPVGGVSGSANRSLALSKIVISLALVVLLVIGLGWMFKKLSLRLPGNRHMKIICALPLGQRERILVIEIQGKQRVIGVTPQSINLLFELEVPLPEEKLASDFHTQLQSFLKK